MFLFILQFVHWRVPHVHIKTVPTGRTRQCETPSEEQNHKSPECWNITNLQQKKPDIVFSTSTCAVCHSTAGYSIVYYIQSVLQPTTVYHTILRPSRLYLCPTSVLSCRWSLVSSTVVLKTRCSQRGEGREPSVMEIHCRCLLRKVRHQ